MTEVLFGALGALAALGLLGGGFCLGWKVRRWAALRSVEKEEKQSELEERRRMIAEQKAFRQMLNYNTETAYGMNGRQSEEVDDE